MEKRYRNKIIIIIIIIITHAQTYTSTHDAIYEQNIDTKTIQNCKFVEHDHN